MWKFNRDESTLSDMAANETVSIIFKINSWMESSDDCGSVADLQRTADFLEMCREKIDKAIDEKIKNVKARI